MVAFAALFVVVLTALTTPLAARAGDIASRAYCLIGSPLGGAGCTNAELPFAIPTECLISSHEGVAGGSVKIVIVEAGADGSYELAKIRYRRDDGSYGERWVVTTKRAGSAGVDISLGAKAKVDTGSGSTPTSVEGGIKVALTGAGGNSYEFGSEDEARKAIAAWKSQNDWNPLDTQPINGPAGTEFWTGGAAVTGYGNAGPLAADLQGTSIVGYTTNKQNGERTVSLVTTAALAGELGVPLPDQYLKLAASGAARREVGLSLTYDKEGRLVGAQVSLTGTVHGSTEAGVDTEQVLGPGGGAIESLDLPGLAGGSAGRQWLLTYNTTFRRPDGTIDSSALGVGGEALARFVMTGRVPTPAETAALREQINKRSRVTFDTYNYSEDELKYGAEGKLGPVALGGEVHVSTTDKELLSGYYYDPAQGTWVSRMDCGK